MSLTLNEPGHRSHYRARGLYVEAMPNRFSLQVRDLFEPPVRHPEARYHNLRGRHLRKGLEQKGFGEVAVGENPIRDRIHVANPKQRKLTRALSAKNVGPMSRAYKGN